MWKNTVELNRPPMTIWSMRIACWIHQTTDTHSEYAILTCFSTATMVTRKNFNVTLFSHFRQVISLSSGVPIKTLYPPFFFPTLATCSVRLLSFFRRISRVKTMHPVYSSTPYLLIRINIILPTYTYMSEEISSLMALRSNCKYQRRNASGVFRAISSVVSQMPGYTSQRRGTVRTLPN